jgi:hypothetical protein
MYFFSGKASQTRFEDESVAPCCERLVIKPEVCLFIPDYFLLVDSCGPGILEDLKCKILEHCSPVDAITHDDQYFHCADASFRWSSATSSTPSRKTCPKNLTFSSSWTITKHTNEVDSKLADQTPSLPCPLHSHLCLMAEPDGTLVRSAHRTPASALRPSLNQRTESGHQRLHPTP